MGEAILCYGKSGSGKSRSLLNFGEDEIFLVNTIGKRLPFAKKFKYELKSDSIETIKANIYSFRKYGPQFVSILSLAYMNSFSYTVEEMAEELNMSPQNFYKKKRYATILFAYEFEKFKNSLASPVDPIGWQGEQLTIDDYMN